MILRKNISLNEEYLKKLEPLMQKHNGNLSAVIREVIDLADAAFQDPDSVKRLISGLKKEQNLTSATLMWSLENLDGRLLDIDTIENIMCEEIYSISSFQKSLNELAGEIYWGAIVNITTDDDRLPTKLTCTVKGKNQAVNKFLAAVVSSVIVHKFNLGIARVKKLDDSYEIEMKRNNKNDGIQSLTNNFGYMEQIHSEISRMPDFWKILINLYVKMDYDMVAITSPFFNDVLAGVSSPKASACLERYYGSHISQIPHEDFIKKMSDLFHPMGIIDNIETDKDSLIIHHGLTDNRAIENLAGIIVELLSLNGQAYTSELNENLIILKRLPDVARIFIKMVHDLKDRKIPFGELKDHYIKMLDVLKALPFDNTLIRSFGNDFGKIMIRNYETENSIDLWDVKSFVSYIQEMNTTLEQESTWDVVSETVIHGVIPACKTQEDDNINKIYSVFLEGIFDGCISRAFGDGPEVIKKKVVDTEDKDDICEVYIAF